MADAISIQELIDARTDAKTLEEAVNGDAVTTVLSRLGESYPTLSNALNQIDSKLDSADTQIKQGITNLFENGGLPATPFATKALMTASALPDGKYAQVTDDTVNNGLYAKTAGAWVKSSYDPLTQAKSYTDAAKNEAINTVYTYVDTLVDEVAKATKSPQVYFGATYPDTWLKGSTRTTLGTHIAYTGTTNQANFFNKLKADVYNSSAGKVYYRLYTGSQINTNGSVSTGAAYTTSGECLSFPNSLATALDPIALDKIIRLPENTKFLLVFVHELATPMSMGYFPSANVPVGLTATPFIYSTSATAWSSYIAPATSNFNQAGFKFILDYTANTTVPTVPDVFQQEVVLPPKIYTVEGTETDLYFKHVVDCDYTIFDYDVVCSKGGQRVRNWRLKPTASDAGEYPFALKVFDKQTHKQLAESSSTLVVTPLTKNAGATKKVMLIGDSWIDGKPGAATLLEKATADVMNIEMIGTKGSAPAYHEGRSGWTFARYMTNDPANVFYNTATSGFDFANYLSVNALAAPDIVIIQLGLNDVVNATSRSEAETISAAAIINIDKMITSIKAASPSIKVALSPPSTPSNQDGWSTSSLPAWQAHINMYVWAKSMITNYKNRESERIYVLNAGYGLDVDNNYLEQEIPVNARNPKIEVAIANNYHASSKGYNQIADQWFAFIKST